MLRTSSLVIAVGFSCCFFSPAQAQPVEAMPERCAHDSSGRCVGDASVPTHSFASCFDDGQCFFGPAMRGEDGFSFGDPCEGLRVLVAMLDPFVDRGFEFRDIVEVASADALARDLGEEPLDEIEPRAGCRREVQLETLVPGEPALHLLCLVRGVIVDDQMQIETGGRLAVDLPQKRQEFVRPVARQTFADRPISMTQPSTICCVRLLRPL